MRLRGKRVAIQDHEIRNIAIAEHDAVSLRRHRRRQRLADRDLLLGMPARTGIPGPVDSRRDGQPRIEWCNRRIRPEAEHRAGVEERAEREGAPCPPGPVVIRNIPIVESMLGLDAGDHPELRESDDVRIVKELRVLDAPACAGACEGL